MSTLKVDTITDEAGTGAPTLSQGLTVAGNVSVDGGTIKLDGAYPIGTANTALGDAALDSVEAGGSDNTTVGNNAGTAITTGQYNTLIGSNAGDALTTSQRNVAIGTGALTSDTLGSRSVAVGQSALGSQNFTSATDTYNTAVGQFAGLSNSTGQYNTFLGGQAGQSNTTASNTTAVGYQAGYSNTTGANNLFSGVFTGYSNTTGSSNTFVGAYVTGGGSAGSTVTTGSRNTILGAYNGNQGGLDIRTSNNNIVLSDGDGNPRVHIDSNQNIILGSTPAGFASGTGASLNLTTSRNGAAYFVTSNYDCLWVEQQQTGGGTAAAFKRNGSGDLIRWYSSSNVVASVTTNGSSVSYNTTSDYRLKENVVALTGATDRIKQIPVYRFNFIADADTTVDGFLAHEVQTVVPEAIHGTHNEVDADGNPVYQGIDQSKLVPLLVATIKELEARITALEAN